MTYIALLRGINVGGNAMVRMADLKICFEGLGFRGITTYINSGNVIFSSSEMSTDVLTKKIEAAIEKQFGLKVLTLVLDGKRYRKIVEEAPKDWGARDDWRHNALFLLPPYDIDKIIDSLGVLKPDIETLVAGDGVLYLSTSVEFYSRTIIAKLVSNPVYKRMTIRNYNTTTKLLKLLEQASE